MNISTILKIALAVLLVVFGVTVGYTLSEIRNSKVVIKPVAPTSANLADKEVVVKTNTEKSAIDSQAIAKNKVRSSLEVIDGDSSKNTSATVSEQASGLIKNAYTKNGKNYIDIDYVSFEHKEGDMPWGTLINKNPKIRTFEVSDTARIYIENKYVEGQLSSVGDSFEYSDFSDLVTIFTENRVSDFRVNGLWNIIVLNGKVVRIEENFRS
jgi:hypothetical protein